MNGIIGIFRRQLGGGFDVERWGSYIVPNLLMFCRHFNKAAIPQCKTLQVMHSKLHLSNSTRVLSFKSG